jgi:hypothetical protein
MIVVSSCEICGSHGSEYEDERLIVILRRIVIIHHPHDGSSTHLLNVGQLQGDYTTQYARRLSSSSMSIFIFRS